MEKKFFFFKYIFCLLIATVVSDDFKGENVVLMNDRGILCSRYLYEERSS